MLPISISINSLPFQFSLSPLPKQYAFYGEKMSFNAVTVQCGMYIYRLLPSSGYVKWNFFFLDENR